MQELDDIILLRDYADTASEAAFATLVARHINKVYSVALRLTDNPHSAEEITQAVFVILASKCRELRTHTLLAGWLCQTARLTALTFIRNEIRRDRAEQEAFMESTLNSPEPDVWPQIAPLLDAAMAHLNEADRHALVLRFFDGKSLNEVGRAMGSSEEAAKKRVTRAVEKLQKFFFKRGVDSSATAITESIAAHSVQAAPALLTKAVTAAVSGKGAAVSTLTLTKGVLKIMAWTKMKTTITAGVAMVLIGGATTTTVAVYRHLTAPKTVYRDELHLAGYATPDAAFESAIWALTQSDYQMFTNSLTPDGEFARDTIGKTEDAVMAEYTKDVEGLVGYKILKRKTVSASEVILTVQPEGPGPRYKDAEPFDLHRIGDEWKLGGNMQTAISKIPHVQLDPNRPKPQ